MRARPIYDLGVGRGRLGQPRLGVANLCAPLNRVKSRVQRPTLAARAPKPARKLALEAAGHEVAISYRRGRAVLRSKRQHAKLRVVREAQQAKRCMSVPGPSTPSSNARSDGEKHRMLTAIDNDARGAKKWQDLPLAR